MTVEKPSNGLKNDVLMKSAKTTANTMHVSLLSGNPFTPKDKNISVSDGEDYSDKFTPENANSRLQDSKYLQPTPSTRQARRLKQAEKEAERIQKVLTTAVDSTEFVKTPQNNKSVPINEGAQRKTRLQTSIDQQKIALQGELHKEFLGSETSRSRSKRDAARNRFDSSSLTCFKE